MKALRKGMRPIYAIAAVIASVAAVLLPAPATYASPMRFGRKPVEKKSRQMPRRPQGM